MAAGDIKAGRAYVEITVKDGLSAGLTRAFARLKGFAAAISTLGATLKKMGDAITGVGRDFLKFGGIVGGTLLLLGKTAGAYGSLINNASQRTGVAAEKLQGLAYAAGLVDVGFETLEGSVRKMHKSVAGLAKGSAESQRAFAILGISLGDIGKLAPEEQLKLIAERMSKVANPTVKASLAMEIFGKSGTAIIPLLNEGSAGIQKMMRRAEELGIVLGKKDVTLLDAFDDALTEVFAQLKTVTRQIGAAIAEAAGPYVGSIQKAIKSSIDWVKNNRGLVVSIVKLAAIVATSATAIGVALIVVGKSIAIVGGLISIIGALLSPIGLAVVGITAFAAALLYFTNVGGKVVTFLRIAFGGAIADILAALKSGSIETAMSIMWENIKITWLEGSKSLLQVMDDLGFDMKAKIKGTTEKIDQAHKKIEALRKKTGVYSSGTGGLVRPGSAGEDDEGLGALVKTAARLQFGGVNAELSLGGASDPLKQTADNTHRMAELLGAMPAALAAVIGGDKENPEARAKRLFDYWTKGTKAGEKDKTPGGIADDSMLAQLRDEARRNPNSKALQDRLARAEREVSESRAMMLGEGDPKRRALTLQEERDAKRLQETIDRRYADVERDRARHKQSLTDAGIGGAALDTMMAEYNRQFFGPEMEEADRFARESREQAAIANENRRRAMSGRSAIPKDKALQFQYQAGIGADLLQGAAAGASPRATSNGGGDDKLLSASEKTAAATTKTAALLLDLSRRPGLAFT